MLVDFILLCEGMLDKMGEKMKVEIYSIPNCAACKKAKALAENKGHNVDYKVLGVDFTHLEMAKKFPKAVSVPQIIVDGEHIGGYVELEKLLK